PGRPGRDQQVEWGAIASGPLAAHKPVIPVLLPGAVVDSLPLQMRALQFLDLREDISDSDRLKMIRATLASVDVGEAAEAGGAAPGTASGASPAACADDQPPFRGSSAPSEIWHIPHPRNPNFTGREEPLTGLRASLTEGGAAALTQAITGLGGVGKTQLALEYAYRHRNHYSVVWWVRSEEPSLLAGDYSRLAVRLGLTAEDLLDQREAVTAARQWLERNDGWLLIFDNAQNPDALRDYLPRGGSGHIIITSRDPNWGGVAVPLPVPTWPRAESIAFLEKRTGHGGDDADALAHELGDLPLALEQAAAYIEAAGIALPEYLDLFRTRRRELWTDEQPPLDYGKTVAATLTIAMQRVEKEDRERVGEDAVAAADLLNLCAFLAPDAIPLGLLRDHADHLPEPLKSTVTDTLALNNAVASLRRYSLLQKDGDALSLHRLVQAVARDRLPEELKKNWAAVVAALVNAAFPFDSDDVRFWPACADLLPHALVATGHAGKYSVAPDETVRVLNHVGNYLRGRADFEGAEHVLSRALSAARDTYRADDPRVASSLSNLALALQDQGDLAGARERFERALAIDLASFGPDHPKVAIGLNNLGDALRAQGDLAGARERLERALEIDVAAYGPEHSNVAIRLNNLGWVLRDEGDLAGARERFERALKIELAADGPDHPNVGICEGNLGKVLREMGELDAARESCERALTIMSDTYPDGHPYLAVGLGDLGDVLRDMGELERAREHYERALEIDLAAYGPEHPEVATDLNNLAGVLRAQGDLAGARERFERALRIFQHFLGDDHPSTQTVRRNLESLGT
ncbi:MAG TPA: FxSxx-COOH system tetratricopeptide repeat protein, partial [Armatimonadota bacterium]|nr:FxSxx-COOH system tetratricopeptide repeat protein [Armatimonadota bacterium]